MTIPIPYKAKQVQLFGGAITIDLPSKIIDVSTFRQVPDSQEVFISTTSSDSSDEKPDQQGATEEDLTKDLSMIIEVLELVDLNNDPEYLKQNDYNVDDDADNHPKSIIKYHFDSLAHDNSSKLATIKSITLPKDGRQFMEPPAIVSERARDSTTDGSRRMTPEPVKCYGLQSVAKFNASEAESHDVHIWLALWRLNEVGNQGRGTDLVLTFNLPNLSSTNETHFQRSVEFTDQVFHQAARSLHIVDWSLFA